MGFFNRKKGVHDEHAVALFDVGSGSIGVAIVVVSKAKLPTILWSKRILMSIQKDLEYKHLEKTMLATLLDLSLSLQADGMPILLGAKKIKQLHNVLFVFASPWYVMQTKILHIVRETPFVLTEQFIHELIQKEEKKFKSAQEKRNQVPSIVIEQKIIQTTLNGYIVSNPFEKKVRHAQIDLVQSAIPVYIHKKASEIANQLLNNKSKAIFHSFILPAFIVTRDIFHGNTNFLQIDISAEVTEVATIHKGTIVDVTSFPHGKHDLIREAAKHLHIDIPQATQILKTYMIGKSGEEEANRLHDILDEISNTWMTSFQKTLGKISTEVPLPKNIYLTTDGDFGAWFTQAILSGDYSDYTLVKTPFKITHLNTKLLNDHVLYSKLTTEPDPFLALEAVFLHKILYE